MYLCVNVLIMHQFWFTGYEAGNKINPNNIIRIITLMILCHSKAMALPTKS